MEGSASCGRLPARLRRPSKLQPGPYGQFGDTSRVCPYHPCRRSYDCFRKSRGLELFAQVCSDYRFPKPFGAENHIELLRAGVANHSSTSGSSKTQEGELCRWESHSKSRRCAFSAIDVVNQFSNSDCRDSITLKTSKMLSQICGMSQDFHKLMKANARDFSGYRRSRISFGTYVQK
jgi:hypothetical protein